MEVYDILGRKVRTLVNHRHQPGYHAVIWNGLNDKGVPVSTGMYFYRITAEGTTDNFVSVKKLIMMK
jgi:flagellar hook assembly protein FlgD